MVYNDFNNNIRGPKLRSWTKEARSEDEGGFGMFNDFKKGSIILPKL